MTEVYDRRFLERIFSKEKRRAERLGSKLTFLLIDLDEFKSVNTQFGHVAGDRVLKELGALLNETLRNSDVIVRYGGDEFVVVMPDCNEEQGHRAIERIGQKVDKWNVLNLIPNYQMSLSCGLAMYEKGMNIEVLLEAADRRMYEDKGRKQR